MNALSCLLLPLALAAQEPPALGLALDVRTELGGDPMAGIRLAPRGCWDGLLLGSPPRPLPPASRRAPEATVEVWDIALQEPPRHRAFRLFLGDFRARLNRALAIPPFSHGAIELGEFMMSDPSQPQWLDSVKVRSLQERFNRQPPHGSPVR
ncbi:hypothetical protein GETHOR_24760 [Geothrix oryzae]|uniref:Uncharacterized protein n=1 Tax=Geothrix oryzae TaxID=2927975 RepID=A0ABN6V1T3_9BACT|nr:hypothetical protein [Geothrix oryzae]BDU70375.1 hypothetical protein GETHOR_24760 [Geothrix oryzae]